MNTKPTLLKFLPLAFLFFAFLFIDSALSAQGNKVADQSTFKIVIQNTKNGVKLESLKGSAWINTSFSLAPDRSQAVDEYGMTELGKGSTRKDPKLADYLFTITKNKNEIILKGIEGTAWISLSFTLPENGKQAIDQAGMTKE